MMTRVLWGADEKLPVLIYKEGEPLRELSRFLAEGEGQLVEVRIPAESMSNANRQVRQSSLMPLLQGSPRKALSCYVPRGAA